MSSAKQDQPKPLIQYCYEQWLKHKQPQLRELVAILNEQGHRVTASWITRAKDKHPEWCAAFKEQANPATTRIKVMLTHLEQHHNDVNHKVYKGLAAKFVVKLADMCDQLSDCDPEALHRVADAIDRINGWAHNEKGEAITAGIRATAAEAATAGKPGLLSVIQAPKAGKQPPLKIPSPNGAH